MKYRRDIESLPYLKKKHYFYLEYIDDFIEVEEVLGPILDILDYVVALVQVRYDLIYFVKIAQRIFQ